MALKPEDEWLYGVCRYPETADRRLATGDEELLAPLTRLLESEKPILLSGGPGTGKTYNLLLLSERWRAARRDRSNRGGRYVYYEESAEGLDLNETRGSWDRYGLPNECLWIVDDAFRRGPEVRRLVDEFASGHAENGHRLVVVGWGSPFRDPDKHFAVVRALLTPEVIRAALTTELDEQGYSSRDIDDYIKNVDLEALAGASVSLRQILLAAQQGRDLNDHAPLQKAWASQILARIEGAGERGKQLAYLLAALAILEVDVGHPDGEEWNPVIASLREHGLAAGSNGSLWMDPEDSKALLVHMFDLASAPVEPNELGRRFADYVSSTSLEGIFPFKTVSQVVEFLAGTTCKELATKLGLKAEDDGPFLASLATSRLVDIIDSPTGTPTDATAALADIARFLDDRATPAMRLVDRWGEEIKQGLDHFTVDSLEAALRLVWLGANDALTESVMRTLEGLKDNPTAAQQLLNALEALDERAWILLRHIAENDTDAAVAAARVVLERPEFGEHLVNTDAQSRGRILATLRSIDQGLVHEAMQVARPAIQKDLSTRTARGVWKGLDRIVDIDTALAADLLDVFSADDLASAVFTSPREADAVLARMDSGESRDQTRRVIATGLEHYQVTEQVAATWANPRDYAGLINIASRSGALTLLDSEHFARGIKDAVRQVESRYLLRRLCEPLNRLQRESDAARKVASGVADALFETVTAREDPLAQRVFWLMQFDQNRARQVMPGLLSDLWQLTGQGSIEGEGVAQARNPNLFFWILWDAGLLYRKDRLIHKTAKDLQERWDEFENGESPLYLLALAGLTSFITGEPPVPSAVHGMTETHELHFNNAPLMATQFYAAMRGSDQAEGLAKRYLEALLTRLDELRRDWRSNPPSARRLVLQVIHQAVAALDRQSDLAARYKARIAHEVADESHDWFWDFAVVKRLRTVRAIGGDAMASELISRRSGEWVRRHVNWPSPVVMELVAEIRNLATTSPDAAAAAQSLTTAVGPTGSPKSARAMSEWIKLADEPAFVHDDLVEWLGARVSTHDAGRVIHTWLERRGDLAAVQQYTNTWLKDFGTAFSAGQVIESWLLAGGEPDAIGGHVKEWLGNYSEHVSCGRVLEAWLRAGGAPESIQTAIAAWLQRHGTHRLAGAVLRAWLESDGSKDFVARPLEMWLERQLDTDSQLVINTWLRSGGDPESVRPHAARWLSRYAHTAAARYVLISWLNNNGALDLVNLGVRRWSDARRDVFEPDDRWVMQSWLRRGGDPEVIEDAVLAWLQGFSFHVDGQYMLNAWLQGSGAPTSIRRYVEIWLSRHGETPSARYLLESWLRKDGADPSVVRRPVFVWTRLHGTSREALYVHRAWLLHGRDPDCNAKVIEAWIHAHPGEDAQHLQDLLDQCRAQASVEI